MENWENNDQLIDDFLMDRLSPKDRTAFEARLQQDAALLKTVETRRQAMTAIDLLGQKVLKAKLDQIHEKVVTNQPARRVPLMRWAAVAAGVAVLVAAFFLLLPGKTDPAVLYQAYYETPNLSGGSRGGDAAIDALKSEAAQSFKSQNYAAAVQQYLAILQQTPNDPYVQLALGLSYMETDDLQNAEKAFAQIIQNEDILYLHQAKWYQALSFLKTGEVEKAKVNLEALAADPLVDFHEEAVELLGKLP